MKINFKSIAIASILLIGVVIMAVGYICATIRKNKTPHHHGHGWTQNNIKHVDQLNASDSLPYYQYKHLLDSMQTMRAVKNGDAFVRNRGMFEYLGTQASLTCDTCNYKWYRQQDEHAFAAEFAAELKDDDMALYSSKYAQNYIKLYAWTIKKKVDYIAEDGLFYVKNGQGYLRTTRADNSKDGKASNKIILYDIPVKFRYNALDNSVLIPVSAGDAKLFRGITTTMLWLYIAGIAFLLCLFLRFIYDTSKGRSFTAKNVTRLKIIAFTITLYPMLVILINWLMKFVFSDYFVDELVLKNIIWTNAWSTLKIGVLLLMLYVAFGRARSLQEEQDLTV